MTKPRNVKFKGILQKPIRIEVLRPENLPTETYTLEQKQKWQNEADILVTEKYLLECKRKLSHLFDHYGIEDRSDHESLAINLAIDFVSGFKLIEVPLKLKNNTYGAVIPVKVESAGAPKVWTDDLLLDLFDDVQKIKKEEKISSDRDALKILRVKKHKKWGASERSKSGKEWLETLEARLQDAKKLAKKREKVKIRVHELQLMAQKLAKKTNSKAK